MKASGVIVDKLPLVVPGVTVVNYVDDPSIRLPREDGTPRPRHEVTCIVVHSTLGAPDKDFPHPQTLIPGKGPSTNLGRALAEMWGTDHRCAGAHAGVDHDGVVYCLQDMLLWESYHATNVNARSIGIEYRQGRKQSEFYGVQLVAGRLFTIWNAVYFGVQRMVPKVYRGHPSARLATGAKDFYGIFGHRDQSNDRGVGDPGDFIMNSFKPYCEVFDIDANEDLDTWSKRQKWLGFTGRDVDGIPGAKTRAALIRLGFNAGQWMAPPRGIVIPASLRPPQ